MKNLKIINISDESKLLFKDCFDENSIPQDIEKIEWQYLKNPINKQLVNIAIDKNNNQTAAIYAVSPVNFKLGHDVYVGSQSLDTITDEDYRGQGLFITLAKSVYEKAKNENCKLVYGFPNGNSIYGFQKKLGWKVLDPVPFLIKPLKSKYFTDRISALQFFPDIKLSYSSFNNNTNYQLELSNDFPIEVDRIWKRFSKDIAVSVNRDKEYLDWRYVSKPNEDYKIIHCYSNENEYLGFLVYTVKGKHGGRIGYIMELVYDLDDKKAGALLLKKAISDIKEQKADCILSWCLDHSPNYEDFRKELFFKMPEKLRPIELHFGVRSFDIKTEELVSNRKNWYLSYSDSDTV